MLVYLITNKKNGKRYVGKTKRTLEQRWVEHVRSSVDHKHPLSKAIAKYNPESFELSILQECQNEDELNIAEKRWITELGTFGSEYNATRGGDGVLGLKHNEKTRAQMSESRKGEKNHNYGKSWGFKWRDHPERLKKFSESCRGAGGSMYGKHHTTETKKKISEAQYCKVVQCNITGEEIATFISIKHAASSISQDQTKLISIASGISRACRFSYRTAFGYYWKYLEQKDKGYQIHGLS